VDALSRRTLIRKGGVLAFVAAVGAGMTPEEANAAVRVELDAAWAEWMTPTFQNKKTQGETWRTQNPGEWAQLKAYRDGTGPRPNLVTKTGRQMVDETAAWIESAGTTSPPPQLAKPSIPTGLTATPQDGAVVLAWALNPVTEQVDGYQVYITAPVDQTLELDVDATTYTVTGLTNGTAYDFRVSAHNASGYGDYTATPVVATPVATSTPPPPATGSGLAYIKLGSGALPPTNIDKYELLIISKNNITAATVAHPNVLFYTSPQVHPTSTIQISYQQANANNWLLKDANGQLMSTSFSQYLLDPGNQAARVAFADSVLAEINQFGAEGIFQDDLSGNWQLFQGAFGSGTPRRADGTAYTAASWEQAVVGWAQYVGGRVVGAGHNMIFNANKFVPGDGRSDTGELVRDFWSAIGGECNTHLMREYFACLGGGQFRRGPGTFQPWAGWQALVAHAHSIGTNIAALDEGAVSSAVYGRASLLLDYQPGDLFMWSTPTDPWDPSWTKAVGAATGAKVAAGNGWTRQFQNGSATVDPVAGTASIT
jgi:hypothetical protein